MPSRLQKVARSGVGMDGLPGIPYVLFEDGSILIEVNESNVKKFKSIAAAKQFVEGQKMGGPGETVLQT